jgi:hypothetical protein
MISRRSLFVRSAAVFAGSLLARLPLAGKAAEVPQPKQRTATATIGTAAERLIAGQLVWQDADGRFRGVTPDNFNSVGVIGIALSSHGIVPGDQIYILHTHKVGIPAERYHA